MMRLPGCFYLLFLLFMQSCSAVETLDTLPLELASECQESEGQLLLQAAAAAKAKEPRARLISELGYLQRADIKSNMKCDVLSTGESEMLAKALLESTRPVVVRLHRSCLELYTFLAAIENSPKEPPPWVLLVVQSDIPLMVEDKRRIAGLKGLQACYAENLRELSEDSEDITTIFHPLPIGLSQHNGTDFKEDIIAAVKATPWAQRKDTLLVGPLSISRHTPEREEYMQIFRKPEYSKLVRVVEDYMSPKEFFSLMAEHKAVLSPPGEGFDCFRHYDALAVGTVPFVVHKEIYSQHLQLLESAGAAFIAPPSELTPRKLEELLSEIQDPPSRQLLSMDELEKKWRSVF